MDKFWENLQLKLTAAPRKKKEERLNASVNSDANDGYSYTGYPDKDEYYFESPHSTSRLGKGSWQTLRDGTEVFVDQKGNVRAGGNHEWHGKPFDTVSREHTKYLARLPKEEQDNLQPVRPRGRFIPQEDGKLGVHPEIREKYQDQLGQNLNWTVDKKRLKDRIVSRMIAENHHKIRPGFPYDGISFLPFKDYTPAHQKALADAHAQGEKLGDLANISDPNARAEWAKNHSLILDNLTNNLDTANLGDGVNFIGDRADRAKMFATNPELLNKLKINPQQETPVKKKIKAPTTPKTVAPETVATETLTPEAPAPESIANVPEIAPKVKKTRGPRKSQTPEMPTPGPSAPSPTPSSISYPKGKNIIQDDLSPAAPVIKRPAKTLRDTYYVDPKYRREKISASKVIKMIIKKSSKLG
jgi:hypothetical protein